jgi:dienelactone hydrolase
VFEVSRCRVRHGALITFIIVSTTPALAQDVGAVTTLTPFLAARAKHVTKIKPPMEHPTFGVRLSPFRGVDEVKYPSGDLTLRAWFQRPKKAEKVPALVYFHSGFTFKEEDWNNTAAFRRAGFAVMCPMLRAENGNPGQYQLFYGELDDARAAIRWVASQPGIDPEKIITFGHSIGGAVSSMLCLYDEPKVLLSGGAAGLFPPKACRDCWSTWLPFDESDKTECDLRVLCANFDSMKKHHVAYMGKDDDFLAPSLKEIEALAKKADAPLEVVRVPGGHMGCLERATEDFLERAQKEVSGR